MSSARHPNWPGIGPKLARFSPADVPSDRWSGSRGNARAAAIRSQKRAGVLSAASSETQAIDPSGRPRAQPASNAVLPAPGGPVTTVSRPWTPAVSFVSRRGRDTHRVGHVDQRCDIGPCGGIRDAVGASPDVRMPAV